MAHSVELPGGVHVVDPVAVGQATSKYGLAELSNKKQPGRWKMTDLKMGLVST
jgi:hypothetical protein